MITVSCTPKIQLYGETGHRNKEREETAIYSVTCIQNWTKASVFPLLLTHAAGSLQHHERGQNEAQVLPE